MLNIFKCKSDMPTYILFVFSWNAFSSFYFISSFILKWGFCGLYNLGSPFCVCMCVCALNFCVQTIHIGMLILMTDFQYNFLLASFYYFHLIFPHILSTHANWILLILYSIFYLIFFNFTVVFFIFILQYRIYR